MCIKINLAVRKTIIQISLGFQAIETEIQSYVADMFLTRTLMESIVPAFCGLFIGSWSDHYGRKPLLVVSMIGLHCTKHTIWQI